MGERTREQESRPRVSFQVLGTVTNAFQRESGRGESQSHSPKQMGPLGRELSRGPGSPFRKMKYLELDQVLGSKLETAHNGQAGFGFSGQVPR